MYELCADQNRRITEKPAEPEVMSSVEWVRRNLGFEPDEHQAKVLSPGIRRGLLNCSRQWGKSTITAAKALHLADTVEESLIVVVSPTERQSGELVAKVEAFARRMGISPKGDGVNDISLTFRNGSRIVGLPGSEATIRGFSAVSLVLVDEAARVKDGIYAAVRPMLATSDGALWMMSTPCGKRGIFYEAWTGDMPWERFGVPATECPRIPASFLQEERRAMPDKYFRQEYMCEFVQTDGALFDADLIRKAIQDDVEPLRF